MANHFHLLIREREETIGNVVKRIASSYVYYYNHKYLRDGHLFKERFKSEPVRSSSARLLPARLCRLARPRTGRKNDISYFTTLLRYIHHEPLPSDACYLDGDEEQAFNRYSDEEAWKVIKELSGTSNASEFQKLDRERQREALSELRGLGASVRQLQRLTGLGRGLIQRI